ncbi:MAG TPA: Sec-independent protein translocase subunit TatA [Pseudonocardiaceae bacterium]|nr:Sec-independent protein translocase subunit TatA [Pseudonocardiaceae bacterium]
MGEFSLWHWLIVAVMFMLLFGANKLPQMARSVGQSMRIFKAEIRAVSDANEPEQRPATASSSLPATESSQAHLPQKPPAS